MRRCIRGRRRRGAAECVEGLVETDGVAAGPASDAVDEARSGVAGRVGRVLYPPRLMGHLAAGRGRGAVRYSAGVAAFVGPDMAGIQPYQFGVGR